MSTIPTSVIENQFEVFIEPHLTVAKRGYISKILLCKIFNYILKKLYTRCQWKELSMDPDPDDPEKKKPVSILFTTIIANGAEMVVWKRFGKAAL